MMNKPEGHPHTEEYCNLLAQINQGPHRMEDQEELFVVELTEC
jgi:hypothetical protein